MTGSGQRPLVSSSSAPEPGNTSGKEKMFSCNEQSQRVGLRIFYFLFICLFIFAFYFYLFTYLLVYLLFIFVGLEHSFWGMVKDSSLQRYCRGKTLTLLKTCIEQTSLELTATFLPLLPERSALKAQVLRLWSSAAGDLSISKLSCQHRFLYGVVTMAAGDDWVYRGHNIVTVQQPTGGG